MEIGHIIQDHRQEAKRTVEDLAEKAACSPGTIRAIEQGRRIPSSDMLKRINGVLGIEGEWINRTTWRYGDDTFFLAPSQGASRRRVLHAETTNIIEARLRLVQKVLDADAKTIEAISLLLGE